MNAFEAKYTELLQTDPFIKSVAKPGRRIVGLEYYVYNQIIGTVALPLTVNVPRSNTIDTQADSDFVVQYASAGLQASANAVQVYNRNVVVQITDLSTGKTFFNTALIMSLAFGAGGFPFKYPSPRVINPNVSLRVDVTNRDTVTNYLQLNIALHGTRIYYAG